MSHAYRPEIDGLRAVAVLPVVLFHAGVSGVSGGYIGVDVFFVISGYLITAIIVREIEMGRFSFVDFYERRARRILPAFTVMVAATLAAAWIVESPARLSNTGQSAVAAALSLSNVYFWLELDYFAEAAEFRPLLHTWSLAVEEQFYIVWPVLLVLFGTGLRLGRTSVALLVFALSLALSVLGTVAYPTASFYLLPARAWELMMGAILALSIVPPIRSRAVREAVAWAGLAMIAAAVALFDKSTAFPGAAALLPCLGAACVIHAAAGSTVGALLSWRPLVFVGLVSYSLYLWHWPPIALAHSLTGSTDLPAPMIAGVLIFAAAAAAASWRFVERPFRDRRAIGRRAVFALSGGAIAAFVTIGLALFATDGVRTRFAPELLARHDMARALWTGYEECNRRDPARGLCRIGAADAAPSVLLWGDSHAGAMTPALDAALRGAGRAGAVAFHNGCAPLPEARRNIEGASCRSFNDAVLAIVEHPETPIETIVLSARWAFSVTGQRPPGEPGPSVVFKMLDGAPEVGNGAIVRAELWRLANRLSAAGIEIVVLSDVPEIGQDVPGQMLVSESLGLYPVAAPGIDEVRARTAPADAILTELAAHPAVTLIEIAPFLCRPDCLVISEGRPVYSDDDHLSTWAAARLLGPYLQARLFPDRPARPSAEEGAGWKGPPPIWHLFGAEG